MRFEKHVKQPPKVKLGTCKVVAGEHQASELADSFELQRDVVCERTREHEASGWGGWARSPICRAPTHEGNGGTHSESGPKTYHPSSKLVVQLPIGCLQVLSPRSSETWSN